MNGLPGGYPGKIWYHITVFCLVPQSFDENAVTAFYSSGK